MFQGAYSSSVLLRVALVICVPFGARWRERKEYLLDPHNKVDFQSGFSVSVVNRICWKSFKLSSPKLK